MSSPAFRNDGGEHPVTPLQRVRAGNPEPHRSPLIKRLQNDETVQAEHDRVKTMITEAATRAPPGIVPHLQSLSPHVAWVIVAARRILPIYFKAYKQTYEFVSKLPIDLIKALYGFSLCFFGGTYVTSLACISAFKMCGWESTKQCLVELQEEYKAIQQQNDRDDQRDEDNDGVADVNQISTSELVQRKINLALVTADPDKLKRALGGLYTASLAVLATVQIKFARTLALGAAVADKLRVASSHYFVPVLVHLLPDEHHKWIETIVDLTCKFVSVSVAWYIQRTISAVHRSVSCCK